jgi:uncharacterized CHY-type Zn-finger protein
MIINIMCPFCKTEFDAEEWIAGKCPNCQEDYGWGEDCLEDYSDCWTVVEWDFEKLNKKEQ